MSLVKPVPDIFPFSPSGELSPCLGQRHIAVLMVIKRAIAELVPEALEVCVADGGYREERLQVLGGVANALLDKRAVAVAQPNLGVLSPIPLHLT